MKLIKQLKKKKKSGGSDIGYLCINKTDIDFNNRIESFRSVFLSLKKSRYFNFVD